MRANAGIFLILALLLIPGIASGFGILSVGNEKPWIVANGADQSNVTAVVTNSSGYPVPNVLVTFTFYVTPPYDSSPYPGDQLQYGSLSKVSGETDANGQIRTTFKTGPKSGTAKVTAAMSYTDPADSVFVSPTNTVEINLDHGTPYKATYDYPNEGTVDTDVPFSVAYTDINDNPIDSRYPSGLHNVTMHVSSTPNDGGFNVSSTLVHDIKQNLDPYGNVSVTVHLATKEGANSILIEKFGSIPNSFKWIYATATSSAVAMTLDLWAEGNPECGFDETAIACPLTTEPYPYVKADGDQVFTLKYTLYDKYNNPAGDQYIWINTTISGEERRYKTNGLGQVWITYGPRETKSTIAVTAVVDGNSSLSIAQNLDFYNTDPVNMEVTANPETMASNDVASSLRSDIKAKIVDEKGNPVAGQTVSFIMGTPEYDGTYTITSDPSLITTSALTDDDGIATVQFKPGAFTPDQWDAHYSEQATGNVTITAKWLTSSKSIKVTWKNYPYLSVTTSVEPEPVALNGIVTVTIKLKGDGYKMQPNPIDAMLVIDKSGSMGWDVNNDHSGTPTKMTIVKAAATSFVDNMSPVRDNVGLVSYAASGSNPVDHVLSKNFAGVKSRINGLNTSSNTATRDGLKKAIASVIANANTDEDAVHAIILLTDGAYNEYGDPLGRGTAHSWVGNWGDGATSDYYYYSDLSAANQNMATYASANDIRLYTIAFGNIGTSTEDTMETLATSTGGKYYHVYTADEVATTYADIAGDLKTTAGVNTKITSDFTNVNVTGVKMAGQDVFDYIYDADGSQGATNDPSTGRVMYFGDNETTVILTPLDQSLDWTDTTTLPLELGTIVLNETYTITYKMKVKKMGSVDVFTSGSKITFNDGEETLTIPHTFLTVSSTLINTGSSQKTIQVSDITVGEAGVFIPLEWDTMYDGQYTVAEEVAYRMNDQGAWLPFKEIKGINPNSLTTSTAQLDMRNMPPGAYSFRVKAYVDGTQRDASEVYVYSATPVQFGGSGKAYIKLE